MRVTPVEAGEHFNSSFGRYKGTDFLSISVLSKQSFSYILTTFTSPLATHSARKQALNLAQERKASPSVNRQFQKRREAG